MRNGKLLSLVLSLLMALTLLAPTTAYAAKKPTLAIDGNMVGMTKAEKKVYKKLKAQMKKKATKEGRKWTDRSASYSLGERMIYVKSTWKNAKYTGYMGGGTGCYAFALKMSDIAFGKKDNFRLHRSWSKIRVGDCVRYLNDTHIVVVLKVVGKKYVVAEGNYNGKVHWGRVIDRSEFRKTGTYVITRW